LFIRSSVVTDIGKIIPLYADSSTNFIYSSQCNSQKAGKGTALPSKV